MGWGGELTAKERAAGLGWVGHCLVRVVVLGGLGGGVTVSVFCFSFRLLGGENALIILITYLFTIPLQVILFMRIPFNSTLIYLFWNFFFLFVLAYYYHYRYLCYRDN